MKKHLYSRFLAAHPGVLHFACHSHHYWPDVTRDAQIQYWDDTAKFVDEKWDHIFAHQVPRAQKLIAEILELSNPEQIVFAQSTHEFVMRLLTSLDWTKKIRILTTDSEFYSFDRQINRLQELGNFEVVKVPTLPFADFHERFAKELEHPDSWDLVFISQVFFNSGLVTNMDRLVPQVPEKAIAVVDGYHGFMAVPTSLQNIQERAFYLAGSYKYAQGGEGACFLIVPKSTRHRPFFTGWFSELGNLQAVGYEVGYPQDALQYAGSTMDFSALYRLIAALEVFKKEGLSVDQIHHIVQQNQKAFLEGLDQIQHPKISSATLIASDLNHHGHFLTFNLKNTEETSEMVKELKALSVQTDSRGSRLRFGFGLYHDQEDIKELCARIAKTK